MVNSSAYDSNIMKKHPLSHKPFINSKRQRNEEIKRMAEGKKRGKKKKS